MPSPPQEDTRYEMAPWVVNGATGIWRGTREVYSIALATFSLILDQLTGYLKTSPNWFKQNQKTYWLM